MEFLDPLDSTSFAKLSPWGDRLACTEKRRVIVRDVESGNELLDFQTAGDVRQLLWSPDGELLLAFCAVRGTVEVRAMHDQEWRCSIDEGSNKVSEVLWGPDSRHILTVSKHAARTTVWSLADPEAVVELPCAKNAHSCVSLSVDGSLVALASRRAGQDVVHIYDPYSWEELTTFDPGTNDLAGVKWNPDGSSLAVWDCGVEYYVAVYTPSGVHLQHFVAYRNAMGVRDVRWSPSGDMLAVASYDGCVRVLLSSSWRCFGELEYPQHVSDTAVFIEDALDDGSCSEEGTGYRMALEGEIVSDKGTHERASSAGTGTLRLDWSAGGQYLVTVDAASPNAVLVWDALRRKLAAVLLQRTSVADVQWDPTQEQLAICTAEAKLFTWTPSGCSSIRLPFDHFECHQIRFAANGECLLLHDMQAFSLAYDAQQQTAAAF